MAIHSPHHGKRTPFPTKFAPIRARRLDAGYALYEKSYSCLHDIEESVPSEEILSSHVSGWGLVEALIILLCRCAVMLERLYEELGKKEIAKDIAIPPGFSGITSKLQVFRNSIEHIDERAYGKINPSKKDPLTAQSIFTQNEFFSSGILRYGEDELDMGNDVLQFFDKNTHQSPVTRQALDGGRSDLRTRNVVLFVIISYMR